MFATDAYRIVVTGTLDPDSSLQFGIDVTNFGADALPGGGDSADLQGFTQVQTVPEPTTIGLVGMGLVAVARRLRGRR